MNEEDFDNLVESIKQVGEIKQGRRKPRRVFEFSPMGIKEISHRFNESQREFALMTGSGSRGFGNIDDARNVS